MGMEYQAISLYIGLFYNVNKLDAKDIENLQNLEIADFHLHDSIINIRVIVICCCVNNLIIFVYIMSFNIYHDTDRLPCQSTLESNELVTAWGSNACKLTYSFLYIKINLKLTLTAKCKNDFTCDPHRRLRCMCNG